MTETAATPAAVIKKVRPGQPAAWLDDQYMTTEDLADLLRVNVQTIHDWRHRGTAPRAHKLNGRLLRFKVSDVREWISAQADQGGA